MALVNHAIANLFNGISQQPASVRLPTQGELQENFHSSVVEGLRKRPPSKHVAKLSSATGTSSLVHTINRDSTERYEVVINSGTIQVFDMSGNAMTVNYPTISYAGGTYGGATPAATYLTNANPVQGIRALTVADYTFVVNQSITTAMLSSPVSGGTLKGQVAQYSDLMATNPSTGARFITPTNGDVYRVAGTPNSGSSQFQDYWMYYDSTNGWMEWSPIGTQQYIDCTTMPWALTRVGVGTFNFAPVAWNQRLVAATGVNNLPSFIGNTITDLFFYRNRFGMLSKENVIMSRSGNFFNFWRKTATALLDDDPIDVSVVHTKVATLRSALSFNSNLLLFSDKSQFEMSARDLLTPKTVNITATTEYDTSRFVKPVAAGQYVYFCVEKGGYGSFKEYSVQPLTYTNSAVDVSAHVPKYVPSGTFAMAGSSIENCIWALNSSERNAIYVYKYTWSDDNQKVQSSWNKWVFDSQDTILSIDSVDTLLYLVIQRADGIYLESIDMQAASVDNFNILVHLDRKVLVTGVYNSGTNITTWTLPYADTASSMMVVTGSGFPDSGVVVNTTRPSNTTVSAVGNWSASGCYIGRPYTSRYRFSEQFYRDKDRNAIVHSQLKMKGIQVQYTNTGYFRAEVTPKFRGTYVYPFTGQVIGSLNWSLGTTVVGSGVANIPLYCDSQYIQIDLVNDSWLPSYFQSAEWEAELSTRSQRI